MDYIVTPEYTFHTLNVSKSNERLAKRCWDLYSDTKADNQFHLAAGLWKSNWLGGGSNERRNHAKRYPYREALHAEQVALMSCRSDIEGATLFVSRYSEHERSWKLSLPCFWCMHQIIRSGIDKVIYTTDENTVNSFRVSSVSIDPISSIDIDYQMIETMIYV